MKKLKLLFLTIGLFISFTFTSCNLISNNDSDTLNNTDEEVVEIVSNSLNTDVDFFTLTNTIETETILANVRIEASFYDSSRGRYNLLGSSIGSGVIIKSEVVRNKLYYYALTNNHVIYNNYSYANYIVEDVYENEYQGTLIYSLNTYDLALIRFEAKEELYVIDLADSDIISGYVASIGEANAKSNTLTYGYVSGYEAFTPNEDEINLSNVTFDVLTHTSYIEPGSSGGALLNMDLKLVGINFASKIDEDGNWEYSYALPVSKINEFLDICYEKTGFSLI